MRVAVVTVGDELLSGETVNTNAAWLGQQLAQRGVTVGRTTVVPDEISDIARVVNEYHAEFDAVIVTGGLGPTHDDKTIEAVAAAFGRDVVESEDAIAWLEEHGGYTREDLTDGTGEVPEGSRVLPNHEGVAPGCVVESCYVLPGVPAEMKRMFEEIAGEFAGEQRYVRTVDADEPESALLDRLAEVQEQFPVKVGSYPGDHVTVRFEGTEEELVEDAAAWFGERVESPTAE
ncbi:competence damage-inducible protein A [Haloarcula hispanica N601]|uniref:Competence damage-inducible protein A n=4 Tax=Haloarcula TaxID=2237 RepID=V5TKJ2_HALHI|nr:MULTISPECIES: molybdopterin-binding protein [Haloarcula]AEM57072.1 molybdenumm cofactor biosynthesis protein / molybdopterin binding domain protein [Haloarcula hispanica ATCC 33960]AHB65861.1 competence damage-inducible protein A [Haloarcula hispanica N601]AJF27003.1 damage-inducible protein CinA [Haloarcula sp. CBA1115]EMA22913.1 molybdenumm cofactor biosynthesis protein/molybdopterin binding domain-containing protein [Haloarcula amylolytica JCM 13557]KAA9407199.1 competence/damage-inducib